MEDSGKHSALRQAEDGSYEFVIDDHGLHEISEVEPSAVEVTADEPRVGSTPASKRVVGVAAGGVLLLAALGVVGWVLLGPNGENDTEVDNVPGFRAYTGGGEGSRAAARPARTVAGDEPTPTAKLVPDEPPPEVEDAEEITESEPGWELGEVEEVVEVEVEVEPDSEESAELVEAEGTEGEESARGLPKLKGRGLNGLTRPGIGRGFRAPKMPTINTNPIATGRLKPMPIRNINPVPLPDGEEDEVVEDEVVEDEVVEDEVVEEEVVDEDVEE